MADKLNANETLAGNSLSEVTGTSTSGEKFALDVAIVSQSITLGAFAMQTDETSTANTQYVGRAAVGTASSSSTWQIFRVEDDKGDLTITYADGDASFDNVWDDRLALTYV